jgi:hypothetical protein
VSRSEGPDAATRRTRLRRALAVVLGVAVALVCSEGAIRQIYWVRGAQHPEFGSIQRPGDTLVFGREGFGHSRWTEHGVRRVSLPPPGSRPILVLGDSFTEAYNVDDDVVYTHRLETLLGEAGFDVPVLNAGRSGASPADYVQRAPRYAALFEPRWTVLQLRAPDLEVEGFDAGVTHFARDASGVLEVVPVVQRVSRFHDVFAPLRERSALANYGIVRLKEFMAATANEPPLFRAGSVGATSAPAPPHRPIADVLALLARAYDERITLLYLPDFDPRAPEQVVAESEIVLTRTCDERGWSCVNLRAAFATFAARNESPYGFPNTTWNEGHMNATGHAATTLLLRDELLRLRALGRI